MELLVKRTVSLSGEGIINYNYQYELMKIIYKAITLSDSEKALKLHDEGVQVDKKKFKLFNYNLLFKNGEFPKEGIKIDKNTEVNLILSGEATILNAILKGFSKMNGLWLSGINLKINSIESEKEFNFKKIMFYKVRSAVVESGFSKEEKRVIYLNPYQQEWYSALGNNLKRKYKAIYNEDYTDELYFDIEDMLNMKKKMVTNIKCDKGFLIGYSNFDIYIEATPKMQKVAYYLGIGQNNSIGMGAISYINGWDDYE